ncbi:MAG: ParA family protein [Myxococcales bacterium]|nr:ParA family protein [Myxococcales bacterium]
MKTIAIATIKGGVGKTIVSAHLAAGLARQGHQTLLLDLDPQGHATLLSGIDAHPEAFCVGDVLLRESQLKLQDVIVRNLHPNLDVAPAVIKMAAQERQLYTWALRLKTVLRALESLPQEPDVVVIDCPPHIGGFTEAALHAADLTIAPIPALAGSIHGLGDLETTWLEMRDGRGGELAGVINLWDQRTSVTNGVVLDMLHKLSTPILQTRIPKCEVINQAALKQMLVFQYAPTHPVTEVFDQLAKETWDRLMRFSLSEVAQISASEAYGSLTGESSTDGEWHVPVEATLGTDGYSIIQE